MAAAPTRQSRPSSKELRDWRSLWIRATRPGATPWSTTCSPTGEIIHEGFQAIYAQVFEPQGLNCFQDADAKGNERLILSETSSQVEYVLFDRRSANEKCLLYVQYRADKVADGSWAPTDAQIIDVYAYDEKSGAVVASGKKSWSDSGTQEYRDLTGE